MKKNIRLILLCAAVCFFVLTSVKNRIFFDQMPKAVMPAEFGKVTLLKHILIINTSIANKTSIIRSAYSSYIWNIPMIDRLGMCCVCFDYITLQEFNILRFVYTNRTLNCLDNISICSHFDRWCFTSVINLNDHLQAFIRKKSTLIMSQFWFDKQISSFYCWQSFGTCSGSFSSFSCRTPK